MLVLVHQNEPHRDAQYGASCSFSLAREIELVIDESTALLNSPKLPMQGNLDLEKFYTSSPRCRNHQFVGWEFCSNQSRFELD